MVNLLGFDSFQSSWILRSVLTHIGSLFPFSARVLVPFLMRVTIQAISRAEDDIGLNTGAMQRGTRRKNGEESNRRLISLAHALAAGDQGAPP